MAFLRTAQYHHDRFHPKQEQAWLAYKAGYNVHLPWGRRTGKTDLIAEIFIEDVEEHGRDVLFCALTGDQAFNIFWPKLEQRLKDQPDWKPNYARHEWTHLPSKAKVSLKGLDLGKHRLRGNAKRLIALDEFAFAKDPSIVKDVFVPMLADYNGQLIYSSSPNGENHFYELDQLAKKGKKRLYSVKATMFDNPYISSEGRQMLLEEYSGIDDPLYRQEVLAEYIVLEGMAFALPQASYVVQRWDNADLEHSFHWRGLDHGFNPDPTACVWLAYSPRKQQWLIYSEYQEKKQLIDTHTQNIQLLEDFPILETYSDVDPQIIAEYVDRGFDMQPAAKHGKNARILRMLNMLKTGKLKVAAECTKLLDQMKTYKWEQDGDDHLIDASNYVVTNATIPELKDEEDDLPVRRPERSDYNQDFG